MHRPSNNKQPQSPNMTSVKRTADGHGKGNSDFHLTVPDERRDKPKLQHDVLYRIQAPQTNLYGSDTSTSTRSPQLSPRPGFASAQPTFGTPSFGTQTSAASIGFPTSSEVTFGSASNLSQPSALGQYQDPFPSASSTRTVSPD